SLTLPTSRVRTRRSTCSWRSPATSNVRRVCVAHVEDRWTVPGPNGRRVRGPRYGVGSRWRAVWDEGSGQRRRKSFATKDAAQAHLEHVAVDLRSGTYVSPKSAAAPFRDVAERWYSAQVHQRA